MSSIRARITLGATVIVAAVLAVGVLLFSWLLERTLLESVTDSAERSAVAMADDLDADEGLIAGANDDDLAQLLSPSGDVLARNGPAAGLTPIISPDADADERVIVVDDDRYLVVTADADDGVLALGVPLEDVDESVSATKTLLWSGLPVLLLLVAAVTWFTVGRSLRPVERMRAEVERVDPGDLDRRVPVPPGRDELGRLARTLNAMLARLEAAAQRQRQFISDASHELRSPIAAMRQNAEVAQRYPDREVHLAEAVIAESDRLQSLVSGMLVLARSDEHGLALRREPVDLDDLVGAEASRLRDAGLTVDGSGVGPARVDGDLRLLSQLVRNLADNAARHADERVAFSVRQDGRRVRVTVDDDGPGVPPSDRERIFERFVRLDDARARDVGGSGLGLAIVAEVARAHGGDVRVDDGPLGGARFVVDLPVV